MLDISHTQLRIPIFIHLTACTKRHNCLQAQIISLVSAVYYVMRIMAVCWIRKDGGHFTNVVYTRYIICHKNHD